MPIVTREVWSLPGTFSIEKLQVFPVIVTILFLHMECYFTLYIFSASVHVSTMFAVGNILPVFFFGWFCKRLPACLYPPTVLDENA